MIVPTALFPPALPFTPQLTAVLVVPVTVAVNCCVPPKGTVAAEGPMLTAMAGGGGGGGGEGLPPVAPQPASQALTAQSVKKSERAERLGWAGARSFGFCSPHMPPGRKHGRCQRGRRINTHSESRTGDLTAADPPPDNAHEPFDLALALR